MHDNLDLIILGLAGIFIFLSWLKTGNLFNPVSIFNLWWGFLLFSSTLNLAGLIQPTIRAYSLLLLSVSMFSIGGITVMSPIKKIASLYHTSQEEQTMTLKLKLFYVFQIGLTIILLYYMRQTFNALKTMDPGSFRSLIFDKTGLLGSNKLYVFYIILPSLYTSAFISIAGVFLKRIKMRYLFISLLNLIMYSMITVGRVPIFIAIMGLSFGFIYILQIRRIKIKPAYILLLSIPVIFIISMSIFRKSVFGSVSKSAFTIFYEYFVWYFTGPFTALDIFLDFCKDRINFEYTHGRAVIAGLEDLFLPLFRRIFGEFSPVNDTIHYYTKIFRSLGGAATRHNSHYTMVMEFMWDAGITGVIIFSYIFGMTVSKVYNNFRNRHSISNLGILLILTYLSLMGMMRWELRYIWSWGTIIGIFLFSNRFILKRTGLERIE